MSSCRHWRTNILAYEFQGDYRRAIDSFRHTLAALEGARRGERFGQAYLPARLSHAFLAWCHAELGTFAEGRALEDEGLRIAQAAVHRASSMFAYQERALPLLEWTVSIYQQADLRCNFLHMASALEAGCTLSEQATGVVPPLTRTREKNGVLRP